MMRLIAALPLFASLAAAPYAWAQTAPQVAITAPASGARVSGPDVTVMIRVTGTTLVPGAMAMRLEDLHVHYMLDTDVTAYLGGATAIPMGDPNIVHSAALSNTFSDVAAGSHRVAVVLGLSDHRAFQPVVAPAVTFSVGAQVPAQLPRTGDAAEPGLLLMLAGAIGLALGIALRRVNGSGLRQSR